MSNLPFASTAVAAPPPRRSSPAAPYRSPTPPHRLAETQSSFAAALGRAAPGESGQTAEQRARESAEQLVAQALILPLLKMLRSSNNAAPPFAPTQGEKQFSALQDADLAQRLTKARHFPLVDRLARDLLRKAGRDADAPAIQPLPLSPPHPSPPPSFPRRTQEP